MAVDQRLPRVGDDDGVWGDILRQYLMKEHYNDDDDNPDNGGHQFVTIRPGTTSAPPLQLTAGSLTTVAAVGAIEFNDGKLYFTTTGSVRKTVAMYDTSGADGDLFYRNSTGTLSRLPIGNTNDVLTVSGGMPIWQPNGAANAVLKSDTATTGYGFVVDEDNMTSNSATKVPTQQSVKAYVDAVAKQHLNPTGVKTSDYSAVTGDYVLVNGNETFTVYLPAAPNDGDTVGLCRIGNDGEVTLDASGKDLINESSGLAALPLNSSGITMAVFVYDAARDHWFATSYIAYTAVDDIIGAGAAGKDILHQDTPDDILSYGLGITATVTELNYVDGVTGNIQTQLDAKASASHTHTASQISDSTTTGRAVLTAASAADARTAIGALATSVVIDEDNMASNSDTRIPTQQSVKAYVDSSISSVDLSSKENVITAGSTAQYWRGDKSWQTLDKTAVGLANVDNTADANKSVASAATLTTARTIQTNLGSTAAASFNGSANVSPGVTGTLPVSNGGTGATSLTSGNVLVGGGTGAVTATKAAPSGAFVGTTDTQTLSAKRINPRSVAPSVASSYTIDSDATDFYTVTGQNQNATFNNPTGTPVDGQKLMVRIKDDGTSRLVGWGSNFRASGITGPLAQTVPGKEHNVLFVYSTGVSKWVCLASDAVGY